MSLSPLRSFTNAAALATTAFDTARSTLKAMAEAAVPPAAGETTGDGGDAGPAVPVPAPAPAVAGPVKADTEAKKPRGVRKGTVLDAYA